MGLEVATYVNDLNSGNPVGASDPKGQGDDHIRLIKAALKNTFPNAIGPLTFQLVDAGALQGPTWILDRNSASPAASDLIGGLIFRGRDSLAGVVDYTNIVGRITDPTSGSTDSQIGLQVRVAGSLVEILTIDGAGIAGVGTGLTALNASNLGSGTVPDARLPTTMAGKTLTGAALNGTLGATTPSTVSGTTGTFSGTFNASGATTFGSTVGVTGVLTGATDIVSTAGNVKATAGSVLAGSRVFAPVTAGTTIIRPNGSGSTVGQLTVDISGNVVAAGDIQAASDEAFKDNIKDLETTRAIDAILHINPKRYTRRVGGEIGIGFIAQDVEQYFPELVKKDADGYRSLAYPNMNAILWSAVKYLLDRAIVEEKMAA